jgi:hypothetical protein
MRRLLLSTADLAYELGVTPDTITAWRRKGLGPPSLKVRSLVRFRVVDVEEWLMSKFDEALAEFDADPEAATLRLLAAQEHQISQPGERGGPEGWGGLSLLVALAMSGRINPSRNSKTAPPPLMDNLAAASRHVETRYPSPWAEEDMADG